MATTTIYVPVNENLKARTGWIESVSAAIAAGNDVEFKDMDKSTDVEVSRILVGTAGYVSVWGLGYTKAQAKAIYLEAGGIHSIGGIHGIRATDTTATGIHVKL